MNDEDAKQVLRELKTIRICAVLVTVALVLTFLWFTIGRIVLR